MTFSIIGIDKKRGEIGIATTTKALACGAIVPDAKANIGAIATQSYPNVSYKEKTGNYYGFKRKFCWFYRKK